MASDIFMWTDLES